jgi:hypothetical protein
MADQKQLVSPHGQHKQEGKNRTQTGFKEIDLMIAYRALIDGFLQSGYNETEKQDSKSDRENS